MEQRRAHITGCEEGGIVGYAWDPERPHRALDVELLAGGAISGTGLANLFDPELARRGIGNGSHAFRVPLMQRVELPCEIVARVKDPPIESSPLRLTSNQELARVLVPSARYDGYVDGRKGSTIHGWAIDRVLPEARARVLLIDGDRTLFEVPCDRFRDDLVGAGIGDGRHGFELPIPAALLDGSVHHLRIVIAGTEVELVHGILAFGPKDALEVLLEVRRVASEQGGLARDLADLAERVEQLEATRVPGLFERFLRRHR